MSVSRTLFHVMRADFFERSRRYSFLITLGLTIFAAYLSLPPSSADYLMMGLDHYRGIYNSAWIGAAVAVICSSLLSLPAFYLVKNAIERDERTGVGQIIATTPLTKPLYTLGKTFSNFVFLVVMVGVIALAAGAMQLIRAEVLHIDLWALLSPFIFSVLPAMAVIAAVAVLFETIPWLRGTFGNVVYFVLWMVLIISLAMNISMRVPLFDLWGVQVIMSSMMKDTAAVFPDYEMDSFAISMATLQEPLQTFTWNGVHWTVKIIFNRILWLGVALGISLLAALLFRLFDPALQKPNLSRDRETLEAMPSESTQPAPKTAPIVLTPLPSTHRSFYPMRVLLAELRLLFKGIGWWWFFILAGLIVAGILLPVEKARQYLLPIAWVLPLGLWSALGIGEKRHNTDQLIYSAPHPLSRQFPMVWLAGVIASIIAGVGVAANMILAGDWLHLMAWATGALFIPSLALALGVWSGSNKLFEVVYMLWWYAGPINHVESLDFMGTGANFQVNRVFIYGLLIMLLLALAVLGRKKQLKR